MNIEQGTSRMKRAGVWLAVIGAGWSALVLCTQMISFFPPGSMAIARGVVFVGVAGIGKIIMAAAPGVLLWIAGWIVEGFAKEPD